MLRGLLIIFFIQFFISCSKETSSTNPKTLVAKSLPESPSNLKAVSLSTTEVRLTWIDNSTNEDGYKIERKNGNDEFKLVASVGIDKTEFKDSSLTPYQTYSYRIYSFNSLGKSATYSNIDSTSTNGVPLVLTSTIDSLSCCDAISGGVILKNGGLPIIEKGLIWSKSDTPSLNLHTIIKSGNDTGRFKVLIQNLEPNTTYNVWAYAKNSLGAGFGNVIKIKTTEFLFNEVISKTGRIWMDRNLGASRAAYSVNDERSYGYLYQWGRANDGHQLRNSLTTYTQSATNNPGNAFFIFTSGSSTDWRNPSNDSLWQGDNPLNNACPIGFRIPTMKEWDEELLSWGGNDAFSSVLKLPFAGSRASINLPLSNLGEVGQYWSSTAQYNYIYNIWAAVSYSFGKNNKVYISQTSRATGFSIRCIKQK